MAEFQRYIKIDLQSPDGQHVYRNYPTVDENNTVVPANMGISEGSMSLDEILYSEYVALGDYNANKFEITLYGLNNGVAGSMPDVTGYTISVTDWGTATSSTLQNSIFYGIVESALFDNSKGDNGEFRKIVAYDRMYFCKDIDIGSQWEAFWTPAEDEHVTHTLEEIREAVGGFVGIPLAPIELIPDANLKLPVSTSSADLTKQWVDTSGTSSIIVETDGEGNGVRVLKTYQSQLRTRATNLVRENTSSTIILSLDHKGIQSRVYIVVNAPNSIIYQTYITCPASNDYVHYTQSFEVSLEPSWTILIDAIQDGSETETAYFKNISLHHDGAYFINDQLVFCYKDYQPGEILAPNISSITFSSMLSAICEIQGISPNMTRDGMIEFIPVIPTVEFTPNYAKNDTTFEDYTITNPTGFYVYANSNTPLLKYPDDETNTNPYIISGNIFLVTMTADQAITVLDPLKSKIILLSYRPASVAMIISDLLIHLGDNVRTIDNTTHLVMSQSLSGPLLVNQTMDCKAYGPLLNDKPSDKNDKLVQNLTAKEYNTKVDNLEAKVSTLVTKDDVQIEITKIQTELVENGVSKVVTSKKYTFDDSGMNISDATSELSTKITNDGMEVSKNSEVMLKANNQGVNAKNLRATTYLIIGDIMRLEQYTRDNDSDRIGCFPMR